MDLKVWKTVKDLDAEVVKGELCTLHEKLHPSLSLDSLAIVSFLVSIYHRKNKKKKELLVTNTQLYHLS